MAQSAFMKRLRDSMKWIFIVVIVLFVGSMVFQRGMGGAKKQNKNDNALGIINGEPIEIKTYSMNVENEVSNARQQNKNLKEGDVAQIRERVWLEMVNQILLHEEVEKKEIAVGDIEITEEVRLNPPDILKQQPEFQVNGQYDYNEFLTWAKSPNSDTRFLAYLQQNMHDRLIKEKLQQVVKSMAIVSRHEALEEIFFSDAKVNAKFVKFSSNSHLDKVPQNPGNEALKKYYEENIAKYEMDDGSVLDIVSVPLQISSRDSAEAKSLIDTLAYMIESGEDFADIATRFSQDPTAEQNRGQLGWVTKGRMVPEFEQVIFELDSGEVSEPFLSQYGWHIAKVNATNDSLEAVFASHVLIQITPSYETIDSVSQIADNIRTEALSMGLKESAKKYGYESSTSDVIGKNDIIPGLGYNSQVVDYALNDTINAVFDVVATPDGYNIIQIVNQFKKGVPSFEDIRDIVLKDYRKDMAARYAFKEARDAYDAIKAAGSIDKSEFKADTTGTVSPVAFIPGIGYDPSFSGVLVGLQSGKLSTVVEGANKTDYYIVEMISREDPSTEVIQSKIQSVHKQLMTQKKDQIFNQWFINIRDNAEIVDRRNNLGN